MAGAHEVDLPIFPEVAVGAPHVVMDHHVHTQCFGYLTDHIQLSLRLGGHGLTGAFQLLLIGEASVHIHEGELELYPVRLDGGTGLEVVPFRFGKLHGGYAGGKKAAHKEPPRKVLFFRMQGLTDGHDLPPARRRAVISPVFF